MIERLELFIQEETRRWRRWRLFFIPLSFRHARQWLVRGDRLACLTVLSVWSCARPCSMVFLCAVHCVSVYLCDRRSGSGSRRRSSSGPPSSRAEIAAAADAISHATRSECRHDNHRARDRTGGDERIMSVAVCCHVMVPMGASLEESQVCEGGMTHAHRPGRASRKNSRTARGAPCSRPMSCL